MTRFNHPINTSKLLLVRAIYDVSCDVKPLMFSLDCGMEQKHFIKSTFVFEKSFQREGKAVGNINAEAVQHG